MSAQQQTKLRARSEPTSGRMLAAWTGTPGAVGFEEGPEYGALNDPSRPWKIGQWQSHALPQHGSAHAHGSTPVTLGPSRILPLPGPSMGRSPRTCANMESLRAASTRSGASPLPAQKIPLRRRANHWSLFARLAPTRGALRDRHECWARDAMGVLVRWTSGIDATGEIVWFWSPDAGIKFRKVDLRNDGGNKARSPGRARISRSTIARGMPDCSGEPAVSNSCAFYFAHEAAGALCIRHSLRPLF
jgi:hypothetical protein